MYFRGIYGADAGIWVWERLGGISIQLLSEMLFSRQASAICSTAQHLDPASHWQAGAVLIPFLENSKTQSKFLLSFL